MEAKKFIEDIASKEGREKEIARLGYCKYLRQENPEESIRQAKIALRSAIESDDHELESFAIVNICNACFYNSDIKQLKYWNEKLLKLGMEHDMKKALGDCYNIKSRLAFQQTDLAGALDNMLQAIEYYLQIDSKSDLLSCYNALGMIHNSRGEYEESFNYLQSALRIAEETNHNSQHSIRLNISNILFKKGKLKEAMQINQQCLSYYRENSLKNSEATAYYNIGVCHMLLGEYTLARENCEKAYRLYRESNQPMNISKTSNAIAEILIKSGDLEEALKYLVEAESIAEKEDLKLTKIDVYENYSKYYEATGDLYKAMDYVRRSSDLNKKVTKENYQEKLTELETKYKTELYRLKSTELDEKNKAMKNQIAEMNQSLISLKETYTALQEKFQLVVTQLNEKDDQLSSQSRMAVMGEMISAIAHQWKQPLNVIWVMAQAIGEAWEYNEMSEEFLNNQLEQIGEQVMYMSETVEDFRNFFKQDYITGFSVADVIEKSIKLVIYLINLNNISLTSNLDETCILNGNPNELSQVIVNIINNAREAILRNEVKNPEIRIKLKCDSHRSTITIFNTGKHIDPHNLDKIFEPYFTTRGKEGTGIGLHICKQIIENKYKGTIKAANCEGGVEFAVEIPV